MSNITFVYVCYYKGYSINMVWGIDANHKLGACDVMHQLQRPKHLAAAGIQSKYQCQLLADGSIPIPRSFYLSCGVKSPQCNVLVN